MSEVALRYSRATKANRNLSCTSPAQYSLSTLNLIGLTCEATSFNTPILFIKTRTKTVTLIITCRAKMWGKIISQLRKIKAPALQCESQNFNDLKYLYAKI